MKRSFEYRLEDLLKLDVFTAAFQIGELHYATVAMKKSGATILGKLGSMQIEDWLALKSRIHAKLEKEQVEVNELRAKYGLSAQLSTRQRQIYSAQLRLGGSNDLNSKIARANDQRIGDSSSESIDLLVSDLSSPYFFKA